MFEPSETYELPDGCDRNRKPTKTQSFLNQISFKDINLSEEARKQEQGSQKQKKIQKFQSKISLNKALKMNTQKNQPKTPIKFLLSPFSDCGFKIESQIATSQHEFHESTAENSIDETVRDTKYKSIFSYYNSPSDTNVFSLNNNSLKTFSLNPDFYNQ